MSAKNRRADRLPRLCTRKSQATGKTLFYATVAGRFVSYGGDEAAAKRAHDATLARWLAGGRMAERDDAAPESYLVEDLVADYLEHARQHYHDAAAGKPSGEFANVRLALTPVLTTFGALPAAEFGGKALLAVRQAMIDDGALCRREINARVHRIRRAFKWAAGMQLVPEPMVGSMGLVEGLRAGRTTARESSPVLPVAEGEVRAVAAELCPTVAAMVWFCWWTGCRPGEACGLRWGMIDRTGPVWVAEFERHKNAWRGRRRVLTIGPKAQESIRPLLGLDPHAFVFSARAAVDEQRQEKRAARRTRVPPSQQRRAEAARQSPRESIAENFTVHAFRRAIERGVQAANAAMVRQRLLEHLVRVLPSLPEKVRSRLARLATRQCVSSDRRLLLDEAMLARLVGDDQAAAAAVKACGELDFFSSWGPNRLRHSAATRLRREEGLEAARVVLGHARIAVTEIYAEVDHERSRQIMQRLG